MTANEKLFSALRDRDFAAAQAALDAGASIDYCPLGSNGGTLFHFFMVGGQFEQARWLAGQGADINAVDALGDTVLMRLIERNRPREFEVAMDLGVDVNRANARGVTPVIRAALFDHGTPFLERLLSAGANPSAVSEAGTTALLAAASEGHLEMVRMLFAARADATGLDEHGQNILQAAVLSRKPEVLQMVLENTRAERADGRIDIDHAAPSHSPALALAALYSPPMVLLLLRAGANPDSQSKNAFDPGTAPLMLLSAVDEDGEATLVKEALSLGANPSLRDHQGNNAVVYAVRGGLDGKRAVLEELIRAGLDPKSPTGPNAISPLHVALVYDLPVDDRGQPVGPTRPQILAALLDMGFPSLPRAWVDPIRPADVDPLPPPLLLALSRKDLESARVLIERGSSLNELDHQGLSVLHRMGAVSGLSQNEAVEVALIRHHLSAIQGKEAGEKQPSMPPDREKKVARARQHAAAAAERAKALEDQARDLVATAASWISAQGGDWNLRSARQHTPAMTMAQTGGSLMLGQIVRFHGADLSLRDPGGWTAADHALHSGNEGVLQAMIGHQLRQPEGLAPFRDLWIHAVLSSPEADAEKPDSFQRRAAFVATLCTLPADPVLLEARDEEGNTPLILAAATGQDDLVRVLLALGADPAACNRNGESALLHAAAAGHADIIRLLRACGADPEQASHNGARPRELARAGSARVAAAMRDPDLVDRPVLEVPEAVAKGVEQARQAWEALAPADRDMAPARRFAM